MEGKPNIERQRELQRLIQTTFDDIAGEISAIGAAKDVIEISGTDGHHSTLFVCPYEFQMTLRRQRMQKKPGSLQRTDSRQILLTLSKTERELHEWLKASIRQKLDTPMLELAVDLEWLGNLFVSTDVNTDEIPKVSIQAGAQEFPRQDFDPVRENKYQDLYFRFVEIVIEAIREFWNEKGKEIIRKKLADSIAKTGGDSAASVADVLERDA